MTHPYVDWRVREQQEREKREHDHNAAARTMNHIDVAFTVEVFLGGQGGAVPLVRSDGDHRTAPLGRYVCIRVP